MVVGAGVVGVNDAAVVGATELGGVDESRVVGWGNSNYTSVAIDTDYPHPSLTAAPHRLQQF